MRGGERGERVDLFLSLELEKNNNECVAVNTFEIVYIYTHIHTIPYHTYISNLVYTSLSLTNLYTKINK